MEKTWAHPRPLVDGAEHAICFNLHRLGIPLSGFSASKVFFFCLFVLWYVRLVSFSFSIFFYYINIISFGSMLCLIFCWGLYLMPWVCSLLNESGVDCWTYCNTYKCLIFHMTNMQCKLCPETLSLQKTMANAYVVSLAIDEDNIDAT